jgi:predicted metal-dependent hydrolase
MTNKGQVTFGRKTINFAIIRSPRRKKTIALSIGPAGDVLVRSPIHAPYSKLIHVVKSKSEWIIKKTGSLKISHHAEKEFVSGESFPYLGRHLRLKILRSHNHNKPAVRLHKSRLIVGGYCDTPNDQCPGEIRNVLINWYSVQAKKRIIERANIYVKKMGLPDPKVLIRDQQKRWGSCDTKGVLRFNWRIIMAPMSIVDYVIVHELCHLKYRNHSNAFWKYLGSILPDYDKRKERLREEGSNFYF